MLNWDAINMATWQQEMYIMDVGTVAERWQVVNDYSFSCTSVLPVPANLFRYIAVLYFKCPFTLQSVHF